MEQARGLPRTLTEKALCEIWSTILSCDRIGVDDDFLDLGGDSLAAMRCLNHIRARFGVELPFDLFFAQPASIAVLARCLDEMTDSPVAE